MRPRSLLALATGLALLIVPVVVAPVGAAGRADAAQAKAIAYWTPQRIANAKPRDLTPVGVPAPKARPGGGGSGGAVTGKSWPIADAPVVLKTGKVFFHMDGGDWQCSGSVVSDSRSGFSMVLTAGHCAIDETGTKEFASNWIFMPSWDTQPASFSGACSDSKYGCWAARGIYVHDGFASAGAFNDQAVTHDWAFVVVGAGGKPGQTQQQLESVVGGGYIVGIKTVAGNERLSAFGYPAAGKYHGNDLTYCAGNLITDVTSWNGSNQNKTWGMACDMTGGSSGGPWFEGLNEATGAGGVLSSLNSYGYSGVKNMYGPYFNGNTAATLDAASTGTSPTNTIVKGETP